MNLIESYKADIKSLESIKKEFEISVEKDKAKPKTKERLSDIKRLESSIALIEEKIELTELRIELEEIKGARENG